MSNKIESGQVLIGQRSDAYVTMTTVIGTGTVTMQNLAGNNAGSDTWVNVPDAYFAESTTVILTPTTNQRYRFILTGDAQVWVA